MKKNVHNSRSCSTKKILKNVSTADRWAHRQIYQNPVTFINQTVSSANKPKVVHIQSAKRILVYPVVLGNFQLYMSKHKFTKKSRRYQESIIEEKKKSLSLNSAMPTMIRFYPVALTIRSQDIGTTSSRNWWTTTELPGPRTRRAFYNRWAPERARSHRAQAARTTFLPH